MCIFFPIVFQFDVKKVFSVRSDGLFACVGSGNPTIINELHSFLCLRSNDENARENVEDMSKLPAISYVPCECRITSPVLHVGILLTGNRPTFEITDVQ